MNEIKSLYNKATLYNTKESKDAYIEAVNSLYENNSLGFISNIEYIIKSDVGCELTENFIDNKGLAINVTDFIIEACDETIRSGKKQEKDTSSQEKLKKKVENFQEAYLDLIDMYKYFNCNNPKEKDYVKKYYGKNKNNVQNRLLVHGLLERYGELAIPDLLITGKSINEKAYHQVLEEVYKSFKDNHTVMQFMYENCDDDKYKEKYYENSLEKLYNNYHNNKISAIKEAVLLQESTAIVVRTDDDIKNIEDLIFLREYQQLCDNDKDYLEEINQLYEDIKDLEEDSDDDDNVDNNIQPEVLHVKDDASFNEYVSGEQLQSLLNKYNLNDFFATNDPIAIKDKIKLFNSNNDIIIITEPCKNDPSLHAVPPEILLKVFYDLCGTSIFKDRSEIINNVDSLSPLDLSDMISDIKNISMSYAKGNSFGYGKLDDYNIETCLDDWKHKLPNFPSMMDNLLDIISKGVESDWNEWNELKSVVMDIADASVDQFTRFCQFLDEYNTLNGSITEASWEKNPINSKTGDVPGYLLKNHDILNYGEEEDKEDKEKPKKSSELQPTLDDFKRPDGDDEITPYDPNSDPLNDIEDDKENSKKENELEKDTKDDKPLKPVASNGGAINNYYYYNSNNTYSHSHNKHDNHSNHHNTSTKKDDHSSTTNTNTSRKVDSHNVSTKTDNHSTSYKSNDMNDNSKTTYSSKNESVFIENNSVIRELRELQSNPIWKTERRSFYKMFNKDINLEGVIKDPQEYIKFIIGGVKFSFKSELPNKSGDKKKIDKFGLVPTSIHQFNVNREKLVDNNRGLANAIKNFFRKYDGGVSHSTSINTLIKKFGLKSKDIIFNIDGWIMLTFTTNIKDAKMFAVNISPELKAKCEVLKDVELKKESFLDDNSPELDEFIREGFFGKLFNEDGELPLTSLEEVINRIPNVMSVPPATPDQINDAEQQLIASGWNTSDFVFSGEYKSYLSKYGMLIAQGIELTGINGSNPTSGHNNVVESTLTNWGINPKAKGKYYVVEDVGVDGRVFWQDSTGKVYMSQYDSEPSMMYDSIADYIQRVYLKL